MTLKSHYPEIALQKGRDFSVRRGHPWIFSDSIIEKNREGAAGELAVIYDRSDQFLAIGFFDEQSRKDRDDYVEIRLRNVPELYLS